MKQILLLAITTVVTIMAVASNSYAADRTCRIVPRSYSGGVFLAHKRFVKCSAAAKSTTSAHSSK